MVFKASYYVCNFSITIHTDKCTVCEQPAKKICNKCSHDENQNSSPYFCNSFVCWTKVHKAADGDHTIQPCDESVCRQEIYEMELLSVICIETSHYVCFTRSEDRWVFFDSMANRVRKCSSCFCVSSHSLWHAPSLFNQMTSSTFPRW